jgi:hypothetical protein
MARNEGRSRSYRGISATPCATAHGAHSGTSAALPALKLSRRVITARRSQTPGSSGCAVAHGHSHSRQAQKGVKRQFFTTARIAGSLASLWNDSTVTAVVRSAQSAAMAVADSQAARNWRIGRSQSLLTVKSSHLGPLVANPPAGLLLGRLRGEAAGVGYTPAPGPRQGTAHRNRTDDPSGDLAQLTNPALARNLWAQVDRIVTDHAPWIPIFNESPTAFVSARVGNYQESPYHGPLLDQMWAR